MVQGAGRYGRIGFRWRTGLCWASVELDVLGPQDTACRFETVETTGTDCLTLLGGRCQGFASMETCCKDAAGSQLRSLEKFFLELLKCDSIGTKALRSGDVKSQWEKTGYIWL